MRSKAVRDGGQEELPLDVAVGRRPTPPRAPAPMGPLRHRLEERACGWPAGTEMLVEPARRLERGDVALAREGERTVLGVYEVRFGRAFLVAEQEALWLGPGVEVVGVVTVAAPPLQLTPERGDR